MADIITTFGEMICRETPAHPQRARRIFVAGLRAFGLGLRAKPDPALPPSRQYIAALCNRAVTGTLAHPERSALTSVFLPCELLHCFGIRPMCAEVFSAFVNGARAEKVFVEMAEASGVPETYCSYHKVLMGGALSGVLPRPGFIVNTSLACDANNLTFRALAEQYRIPQFYVDVPSRREEESVRYVADQLRELTSFLEQQTGRTLDEALLRKTLDRSRRTIENFRACMPYRRERYLATDLTSEMYEIFTTHIALGAPEAERYSELLLRDFRSAPPARGTRLVWVHTIPQWQDPLRALFNHNENYQVIACDFNHESLLDMDPEQPYESMARRLVYSAYGGSAQIRAENARALARELKADGAVCFCHWGCKQTMGSSVLLQSALEADGIPTLILNGDGCDRANSSDGQVATRMNAFLEMLEGRTNDLLCL